MGCFWSSNVEIPNHIVKRYDIPEYDIPVAYDNNFRKYNRDELNTQNEHISNQVKIAQIIIKSKKEGSIQCEFNFKNKIDQEIVCLLKNRGYNVQIDYPNKKILIDWLDASPKFENEDEQKECPICFEPVSYKDRLRCGHKMHIICVPILDINKKRYCQICRDEILH